MRLAVVERQIGRLELEQAAAGADACELRPRLGAAGEQSAAIRQASCRTSPTTTSMASGSCSSWMSSSTSTIGASNAASAAPRRGAALDQIEATGTVSALSTSGSSGSTRSTAAATAREQHDGVVVAPLEPDPGERARVRLGPLVQERGLAVAGWRRDAHDRRLVRREQRVDQSAARHRAVADDGRVEAGVVCERARSRADGKRLERGHVSCAATPRRRVLRRFDWQRMPAPKGAARAGEVKHARSGACLASWNRQIW